MLVRGRLLDRLRARWFAPVTVVSAPAGYGKTTLLAQAVTANEAVPVGIDCWMACTPDMAAASTFGDGLRRAVGAVRVLPVPGVTEVATAVVEAMWRRSPQQVALLIDDVHHIPPDSGAAKLLASVLAALPANGHVVLAGRREAPVPLARLEVEGRVVRVDQDELAFTDAEVDEFAVLRGAPGHRVASCGGWPALAELCASARESVAGDYVGEEVLGHLPAGQRRELGLLAHVGPFDGEVARAVLGPGADVPALVAGLPLVTEGPGGERTIHSLWRSLLARDVTPADVAEARRRAGVALLGRSRIGAAVRLLIEAEAWDDLGDAIVAALGVAHPPVARDVLAGWYECLPDGVRDRPAGRLLAAVADAESDPAGARDRFMACAGAFRSEGEAAGELACLVQLGQMAWWADDTEGLATVAGRVFELEAAGVDEVVPLACLARALLFDIANDSRSMLAELDRIRPGSLNDAWWGIVVWARAIALLELGHTPEALEAADEALSHAELLYAPLAQTTRLQALWYQGRAAEAMREVPAALDRVKGSGFRYHAALLAAQSAVAHAFQGRAGRAAGFLAQARTAATAVAQPPRVDTNLSVAEAAVAVVEGDEAAAAAALRDHLSRRPVREGITAAPQQRHLALLYVLVPETRPVWDAAELGPAWAFGRELARAVAASRDGGTAEPPPLGDVAAISAHLPPPWVAELGVAAVAAGREDGWQLLDRTWSLTRPAVAALAEGDAGPRRDAAGDALARLAVPPTSQLELRLLGPVELLESGAPVQSKDWRRERVRSLLAYLALNGTVSRGQVADDLWPGLDVEAQSRNLRVTLTYLLRVLEPGRGRRDASFFVRQHGNNVSLHAGEWLTVDVWDFDAACEQATREDRQGASAAALGHALRAVELWRGEPTDLASDPWAVSPVEQRRVRFAATATRAGELVLARGDPDGAQDLAERAIAVDPWLEAAHRLGVAAHRAKGDDLAARRALRRYRDAIGELGLGPDEATLMVERLLDGLPPAPPAPGDPRR
jgi:LuxR family maltose regulon positive regulatory protein